VHNQDNELGLGAQKKTRTACEELLQCACSKIQSVVIDCEDFKCDYKVVFALKYSNIQSVIINCNSIRQLTNKLEY
jgi:hypothetical protein